MKKYKVTATPITPIIPDVEAHEYIVFAEDEEGAKQKAFDQMLAGGSLMMRYSIVLHKC